MCGVLACMCCVVCGPVCGLWACVQKVSGVLIVLCLISLRQGLSLKLQLEFFFSSWAGSQQAPDPLFCPHPAWALCVPFSEGAGIQTWVLMVL